MSVRMGSFSLVAFCLLTLQEVETLFSQADPPRARIQGLVLRSDTNEPAAGVRVSLTRASGNSTSPALVSATFSGTVAPPAPLGPTAPANSRPLGSSPSAQIPPVTTNQEGLFSIEGIEPGSYRLGVVGGGFVRQEYGQKAFPGQGTTFTITAGQELKDIVFRLIPTGSVIGGLWDPLGQPAVGVPVNLIKVTYNAAGQRQFSSAGLTRTNDRGEYRLFWVTPGKYLLAAGNPPGPGGGYPGGTQSTSPNETGDTYVLTYYPGVTDTTQAASITLDSGNEVVADFRVSRQEAYRVRGRILDGTTGRPPSSVTVSLSFSTLTSGATLSYNPPYNPATGGFELPAVVPGTYTLHVKSDALSSRMPLEVRNNVEGLQVVLSGTRSFAGRIIIEGQLSVPLERLRVHLLPPSAIAGIVPPAVINSDGSFRLDKVPLGDYRVLVTTSSALSPLAASDAPFFVKQAQFERADVLNQLLTISTRTEDRSSLDILLSPNVAELQGAVTNERLQATAGAVVVLVPADRTRSELFLSTTTDQDGRFALRGIRPGTYKAFAWEVLENFGYFDLDLIKDVETHGKSVEITESSRQHVDLRLIPQGQ